MRGCGRKKIEKHLMVNRNYLALPRAPRRSRPPSALPAIHFLPKGDCVPLGTLPEKRENADGKHTDKPKFEISPIP